VQRVGDGTARVFGNDQSNAAQVVKLLDPPAVLARTVAAGEILNEAKEDSKGECPDLIEIEKLYVDMALSDSKS
jgi:hypothetical protein